MIVCGYHVISTLFERRIPSMFSNLLSVSAQEVRQEEAKLIEELVKQHGLQRRQINSVRFSDRHYNNG